MCCKRFWTSLQVLWSAVYVICGGSQLISGIFFLISIPAAHLSCNIGAGTWNIIIGIVGGIVACLGNLSSRRQEIILYMAVSILTVNSINVVLCEWGLYFTDMTELLKNHPNHILIDYACFATRIATATVIAVSFLDTQFAFCSMQIKPKKRPLPNKQPEHRPHHSHDQLSDIEFIIPRPKQASIKTTNLTTAYSQSWVFDSDNSAPTSNPSSPYMKILENGTSTKPAADASPSPAPTPPPAAQPLVHVEDASDDSTSAGGRQLGHMRSFSRGASPPPLSAASSRASLAPLYASLTPRADALRLASPQPQYASLMRELQRAIVAKRDPPSDSAASSPSDADFSKELEAALRLIHELESPSAPATPSPAAEPAPAPGKNRIVIRNRHTESQSTSGYSSPVHPPSNQLTPSSSWSTTSSLSGDVGKPLAYSIHKAKSSTVISLYPTISEHKTKSVTLVNISAPDPVYPYSSNTTDSIPKIECLDDVIISSPQVEKKCNAVNVDKTPTWSVKSLLRKRKQTSLPKLCPELEAAIIKSESLAYLSELELLARHQRNNKIHREIEERVIQQLGTPRTESKC